MLCAAIAARPLVRPAATVPASRLPRRQLHLQESQFNVLDGAVDKNTPEFRSTAEQMRRLVDDLSSTVTRIKQGGGQRLQEKVSHALLLVVMRNSPSSAHRHRSPRSSLPPLLSSLSIVNATSYLCAIVCVTCSIQARHFSVRHRGLVVFVVFPLFFFCFFLCSRLIIIIITRLV